jgi:hypothetical protein
MATLTINQLTDTATIRDTDSDIYETCASGGDEFANAPDTFVIVENAHNSASRTITFAAVKTTVSVEGYGKAIATASVTMVIDPSGNQPTGLIALPPIRFNDSSHKVQVTYSDSAADLKIAVFQLGVNRG